MITYPFVRIWWKAGKVDFCSSGDYFVWDGKSDGAEFRDKVKKILKKYDPYPILHPPEPEPEPQHEPEPEQGESSDSNLSEQEINDLLDSQTSLPEVDDEVLEQHLKAKLISEIQQLDEILAGREPKAQTINSSIEDMVAENQELP